MNEEAIGFMRGIEVHVCPGRADDPAVCEARRREAERRQIIDERCRTAACLDEARTIDLNHRVTDNSSRQVFGTSRKHARLRPFDINLHRIDARHVPSLQAIVETMQRYLDGRPVRPVKQGRVVVAETRCLRHVQLDGSFPLCQTPVAGVDVRDLIGRQVRTERQKTTGLGSTAKTRPSRPTRSAAINEKYPTWAPTSRNVPPALSNVLAQRVIAFATHPM